MSPDRAQRLTNPLTLVAMSLALSLVGWAVVTSDASAEGIGITPSADAPVAVD
ncbi:MAG: hypothetical protein AAF467_08095 [Actinomycetota bacterium]